MAENGKVFLIGAGPGDVELLTVKAARALSGADIILLDNLVNPEIAQYFKPTAKVIPVGKRGGCKSTPQALIHEQMVSFAKEGKTVARVKGGDPFVFGRGGEELRALFQEGIDVQIFNGITSGIAAPSLLGIPLTHRDCAHSVVFITGHNPSDGRINWRALVDSQSTIVIYMGIRSIGSITRQLINAGLHGGTPAVAIQMAPQPWQHKYAISTIAELPKRIDEYGIGSPAIIVVGKVVGLADGKCLTNESYPAPPPLQEVS